MVNPIFTAVALERVGIEPCVKKVKHFWAYLWYIYYFIFYTILLLCNNIIIIYFTFLQ